MGFITSLSKHSLSPITGKLKDFPISLFLRNLDKNEYSILENYNLEYNGDSTVVDYIVSSKYGIFVINSKNMSGIISNSNDGKWIQKINGYENIIENPLLETHDFINALKEVIPLKNSEIIPITVFSTTSKLEVELDGVINSPEIVRKIKSYNTPAINQKNLENINSVLQASNSKNGLNVVKYPVTKIIDGNKKYFCPKCGSKLKVSKIENNFVCPNNKKCGSKL
ncbi:DNA-directed RNA polymerase subunit RPC12/RpoP [Methanococcus maripaludis]|uniref:DNA-directed RNA polymerase subunit RPC12/RpoP n=1 Tax=Methanococcus maripaludis TaxID=39152 RepID=A0A7J9NRN8_METMI|nr:nuclease-related domain-containing protein [Methanococcus maripaludis]MBA2850340.1 DNA-directed RNA polymerase subunit RPC12/RpoP [Methanococcus maripaludis]